MIGKTTLHGFIWPTGIVMQCDRFPDFLFCHKKRKGEISDQMPNYQCFSQINYKQAVKNSPATAKKQSSL